MTHCHNSSRSTLSQGDHRHRQRPRTPTLKPHQQPGRRARGGDCVCHVPAETQQGEALVFSLHCPPNPLIITDRHLFDIPLLLSHLTLPQNQQLASNQPNIIPPSSSFSVRSVDLYGERQQGRTKELVEVSSLDPAQPFCLLWCQGGAVFSTVS